MEFKHKRETCSTEVGAAALLDLYDKFKYKLHFSQESTVEKGTFTFTAHLLKYHTVRKHNFEVLICVFIIGS